MNLLEKIEWGKGVKIHWICDVFRMLLGLFLLYAGISHLTFLRVAFAAQVPNWVPMETDLVVVLSGIVEILLGASLLLLYRWKALVGTVVFIFFVMVFPGNISQYVNHIDSLTLDSDSARLIRLLLEPILWAWALWSTGAYKAFTNRDK